MVFLLDVLLDVVGNSMSDICFYRTSHKRICAPPEQGTTSLKQKYAPTSHGRRHVLSKFISILIYFLLNEPCH